MLNNNMAVLANLARTRKILKEKVKRMKLGELDRVNLLENTFKPISKPLNELVDNLKNTNEKNNVNNFNNDNCDEGNSLSWEDEISEVPHGVKETEKSEVSTLPTIENEVNGPENKSNSENIKKQVLKKSLKYKSKYPLKCKAVSNNIIDKNEINGMPVSREVEHRNKPNKRKPIDTIHTQFFGKKQKLDNIVSVRRKVNFMNNCERPAPYFPSKANDDELLSRAAQSEMMTIPTNQNQPETDKGNTTKLDILRRIKEYPELWEKNKHEKRKRKNQLNEDFKRVKITPTITPSKNPLLQNMLKRKSKNQLNEDSKRVKITPTITSSKNPLLQNIKLLKDLKVLDTLYGMNIDRKGRWRFGLKPLKINSKNVIQIGNEKWKMTPGLFELLFHIKPQHYKKYDLEAYRQILLDTNVHKRNF